MFTPTIFPHFGRWAAVASGLGTLVSVISEYGFDVDFPLTPSLWLAVAAFTFFAATAHAAIGSRIHSIGKRETGTYLSGAVPSLSDSASSISDRSPSICQNNFDVAGDCHDPVSSSGMIVTIRAAIPVAIFLNSATTRGPPSSDNQIDPARHSFAAPPLSEIYFRSSSPLTIHAVTGESA